MSPRRRARPGAQDITDPGTGLSRLLSEQCATCILRIVDSPCARHVRGPAQEVVMDLRERLAQGTVDLVRAGAVRPSPAADLPFVVVDGAGRLVEPVSRFLRELVLGDSRPSTCRSYAQDLLRWLRLLAMVEVAWDRAGRGEVVLPVAWMRNAPNPQRRRRDPSQCGAANLKTGKPNLGAGYAKATINHTLTAIAGLYDFHLHTGGSPLVNPVPAGHLRRQLLAHRSPLEPVPLVRRAPLRQRTTAHQPRSIPDRLWTELFEAMRSTRDRALLACYACSGARASELLRLQAENIDWQGMRMWVPRKGSDVLSAVPLSPEGAVLLAAYLSEAGLPLPGTPVWRASRGRPRPLSYSAVRRMLQRANEVLGTNWSLHDLRHTTCARMAGDPNLTLAEIQAVMRHAQVSTTQRYMPPRLDELIGKLQAHYQRPAPDPVPAPGDDPADFAAVFGD
ncbi:MAG: site-specific integrase [Actinomycetota bacterium]|nr:site-specific integrase [Actinomycetota bacterium]